MHIVVQGSTSIQVIFVGVGDIVGAFSGDEIEKRQNLVPGIQVIKADNPLLDF